MTIYYMLLKYKYIIDENLKNKMLAVMMGCHAQDLAVLFHLIAPWIIRS
jgi:hypothetical protein